MVDLDPDPNVSSERVELGPSPPEFIYDSDQLANNTSLALSANSSEVPGKSEVFSGIGGFVFSALPCE